MPKSRVLGPSDTEEIYASDIIMAIISGKTNHLARLHDCDTLPCSRNEPTEYCAYIRMTLCVIEARIVTEFLRHI